MNQIGAVRRIDELGRIVIPKGIRSRLRIHEGDRLEIAIGESGKIEIQKYNAFSNNFESITNIAISLSKELHRPVAIINDGAIITKSDDNIYDLSTDSKIEKALYDRLFERKTYVGKNETITPFGGRYNFILYPIAYNSEILGGILIFTDQTLTEEEIRLVHAFRNLITTILKVLYNRIGEEHALR